MVQNKTILRRSQELRKHMTKEERHLWYDFLKTYPISIHRQYIFDNYIVDFYCHKAKLVIELDGSQHCDPEQVEYDRRRTAALQQKGLYVLRISNRDVTERFSAVCEAIDLTVRSRLRP